MTALAYTLGAFGLILLLARLKVPLAAAILLGAGLMGALFDLSAVQIGAATARGAVQPMSIALVVITVLLLGLSEAMRSAGQLEEIVSLAGALLRRPAMAMAALPALIGLLPMPAGALFSAPMVESAAGNAQISGGRLSAVNYWFRHIWEHWWPLYPGVILAMTLTGSGLGQFIAFQLPLGIFMAGSGLLIFRGIHPDLRAQAAAAGPGTRRKLIRATSSIWVIMAVWGAVLAAMRLLPGGWLQAAEAALGADGADTFRRFLPVTVGLLASLVWTVRLNRLSGAQVRKILTRRSIYALAGVVVSVMVYQYMLKHVGAAPRIGEELTGLNVPVVLVVAILPFIAGMVTGLAIGFVGTSFPIILALVAAMGEQVAVRPYAVLAYACGHLGMMLSPLHLCHVVSNRYFNTSFGPVYRRILPSAVLTGALATGYFLLLRAAMG